MKVTCNIIRDVLPLYVENMVSDDTSLLIEEHIEGCQDCTNYLNEIKTSGKPPIDTDVSPLLKIKSTLRKKKIKTAIISIMLSIIVGIILIAFLTAPEYIPYSEKSVSISEVGDGTVLAIFTDQVSGFDMSIHPTDDNTGYVYHITTWDNIWNQKIKESHTRNIILNANNENVVAVYYYQTNHEDDILIYGKDIIPNGGVVTLPRLFLVYYLTIALASIAFCVLLMILFRRNEKLFNLAKKLLFLPVAYLIGHLIIKGFNTVSYSATRDFYAILLITIPLYIAFLIAINLIKADKNKREDSQNQFTV
jgi:hypothetical protein